MRYAIPVAGGRMCLHFGHCEEFVFIDTADGSITAVERKVPPPHAPGVIPAWVAEQGAQVIIAGGMGARAQSLFRHYGIEGLQHHVREHVRLARDFASWVQADSRFELAAPAPLNLITFRHTAGDEINQRILDHVNLSGKAYLTHTKLDGKLTLRMSIGQTWTQRQHVENAWRMIGEPAE